MGKVAIATDTNSGLSIEEAKELGIFLLSMPFAVDGKDYKEGIDLNHEQFYKFLEEDKEVFTSQPAVVDVMDFWDSILAEYDELVYIPMSSGLSSSYQTAMTFSSEEQYEGKVFIVNNQRISVTQRYSAIEAKERADAGWSGSDIKNFLEATKFDSSIYITVDTLKYLKKGGRVTPAGAAIASVLNIKPVLQIQGEKLDAFAKARGMKQARVTMIKAVKNDIENRFGGLEGVADNICLDVAYTAEDETVESWIKELKEEFPNNEIYSAPLSISIGCHIGHGSLAVAVCQKHPL